MLECLVKDKKYTLGLIKMIEHHESFQDFYERKNFFKKNIIKNIEDKLIGKIAKI